MAVFLSPEWLALLGATLPPPAPDVNVRIEQVVTGGPDGDVRYQVVLGDGAATVEPTCPAPADVVLELPYDVAVGLTRGAIGIADAIQAGAVTVRGDLRRLTDIGSLGKALDTVRAQTTYG